MATTKATEVNYKKNFCERYFDKGTWDLDVLNQVDVLLKDKKGKSLLYIESKFLITNETELRKARAQVILTNKKQKAILSHVALIYQDADKNDVLEFIDCSENSVMYNNDLNWNAEKPSNPSKDAIDRINDRILGRITIYRNDEIREFYGNFKQSKGATIQITEKNFNVVYNSWKNEVHFREEIGDEQDLINLFLVDILNGTKYKKTITDKDSLLKGMEQDLIREGTNLNRYQINYLDGKAVGIIYTGDRQSLYYTIANREEYVAFWKKYQRPPEEQEFLKILERSATLYSEKYRRDTGGEYTPTCFVEKQNEILSQHYNLDEFIVFDPCAGVGNLENQFGKEFKQNCYLSTLEQMDVDICKIKGFENAVQFDYLRDDAQPKWKYKGTLLDINEICRREHKKLMVVMNPPYTRKDGFKYDLAIEFFIKVLKISPDVIVYYCKTEFFLRDTVSVYTDSKYKIQSHIFSNAEDTFDCSKWSISQIIFDKDDSNVVNGGGYSIHKGKVPADRYELNTKTGRLDFIKRYTYDNSRPDLIKEIGKEIKQNMSGLILGQFSYLGKVIVISNGGKEKTSKITTGNLKWCMLSKGINFNSNAKYFEWNYLVYRGVIQDIPKELFNDAIMFSMFYKNNQFSNKFQKNYIMPFTAEELGCSKNELNVLFPQDIQPDLFNRSVNEHPFDFRQFLKQFDFSKEARDLYAAALQIFRYYHSNPEYKNKNWNDSFYDITNAIVGKTEESFVMPELEKDTRITRTKVSKGMKFGKNSIRQFAPKEKWSIFEDFFAKREVLARKINKELLDAGLLLWERENIF